MKFFNARYRDAVGRWQVKVVKAVDAAQAIALCRYQHGNCFSAAAV